MVFLVVVDVVSTEASTFAVFESFLCGLDCSALEMNSRLCIVNCLFGPLNMPIHISVFINR